MESQLRPRERLKELLERAIAPREREKSIRETRHQGLATMHAGDEMDPGDSRMGDLASQQRPRHHADDLSVFGERGVSQGSHQSDVASTVDELPSAPCDRPTRGPRRRNVRGVVAVSRATKNAYRIH